MTSEARSQFTQLEFPPNPHELACRQVIDQRNYSVQSARDFARNWHALELNLPGKVQLSGQVRSMKPDRFLCGCFLIQGNYTGLHLTFAARPNLVNRHHSPISLYNTKVNIPPEPSFSPFAYYDTLMYLINRMSPSETPLSLYVRQRDSLQALEAGEDPSRIPLVKVFQKAGWQFEQHFKDWNQDNIRRKHRLVLSTQNEDVL